MKNIYCFILFFAVMTGIGNCDDSEFIPCVFTKKIEITNNLDDLIDPEGYEKHVRAEWKFVSSAEMMDFWGVDTESAEDEDAFYGIVRFYLDLPDDAHFIHNTFVIELSDSDLKDEIDRLTPIKFSIASRSHQVFRIYCFRTTEKIQDRLRGKTEVGMRITYASAK